MHKTQSPTLKAHPPGLGICERRNSQFKSSKASQDDAGKEIKAAFAAHKCKLMDNSQNALRIVRESKEDKKLLFSWLHCSKQDH